jgi:hypothetical protein
VEQVFDRLLQAHDLNLDTLQKTRDRANTTLREKLLGALDGEIVVPANCGQELHDVIEVTDSGLGRGKAKTTVMEMELLYSMGKGPKYQHTLSLGDV